MMINGGGSAVPVQPTKGAVTTLSRSFLIPHSPTGGALTQAPPWGALESLCRDLSRTVYRRHMCVSKFPNFVGELKGQAKARNSGVRPPRRAALPSVSGYAPGGR